MLNSIRSYLSRRAPVSESGSVLALAVWVLVFLSFLTAGLYAAAASQITLANRCESWVTGRYIAGSVCQLIAHERMSREIGYDALGDLGSEKIVKLGQVEGRYSMIDEESKININTAPVDVLARFLVSAAGLGSMSARDAAQNVVAYRSTGKFRVAEEFLCVEDVSSEVFSLCKEYITVYGNGAVNLNTAPAIVLESLGFDNSLVEAIMQFRFGVDGKTGSEDDGVFKGIAGAANGFLTSGGGLTGSQLVVLADAANAGTITVNSTHFMVSVAVSLRTKPVGGHQMIVDSAGVIKQWLE